MDGLASVGRAFATPQFIVAVIFGVGLIIGGIYLLVTPPPPEPSLPGLPPPPPPSRAGRMAGGGVMVVIGSIIPYAAWWRRKLIRSNPNVAALVGLLDVESMVKYAIN